MSKKKTKPEKVKWLLEKGLVISSTASPIISTEVSEEFEFNFNEEGKYTLFALSNDDKNPEVLDRYFIEILPSETKIKFTNPLDKTQIKFQNPIKVGINVVNPENLKNIVLSFRVKGSIKEVVIREFGENELSPSQKVMDLSNETSFEDFVDFVGKEWLNRGQSFLLEVKGYGHDDKLLAKDEITIKYFSDVLLPKELVKEYKCKKGILRVNLFETEHGIPKSTGTDIWWALDKSLESFFEFRSTKGKRCCVLVEKNVRFLTLHLGDKNSFEPTGDDVSRSIIIHFDVNLSKEDWKTFLVENIDEFLKSLIYQGTEKIQIAFEKPKEFTHNFNEGDKTLFSISLDSKEEDRELIKEANLVLKSIHDEKYLEYDSIPITPDKNNVVEFVLNDDWIEKMKVNHNYELSCVVTDGVHPVSNAISKTIVKKNKEKELLINILIPKGDTSSKSGEDVDIEFEYVNYLFRDAEINTVATPYGPNGKLLEKNKVILETRTVKTLSSEVLKTSINIFEPHFRKYEISIGIYSDSGKIFGKDIFEASFDLTLEDIEGPIEKIKLLLMKRIDNITNFEENVAAKKRLLGDKFSDDESEWYNAIISKDKLEEREVNVEAGEFLDLKYYCLNLSNNNCKLTVVRHDLDKEGKGERSFEMSSKTIEKGHILTESLPVPLFDLTPGDYRFIVKVKEEKTFGAEEALETLIVHLVPREEKESASELGSLDKELAVIEFLKPVNNGEDFTLNEKLPEFSFVCNFKDKKEMEKVDFVVSIEREEISPEKEIVYPLLKRYILPYELKYKKNEKYKISLPPEAEEFIKKSGKYRLVLSAVEFYEGTIEKPTFDELESLWDQETGELRGMDFESVRLKEYKGKRMRRASNYAIIYLMNMHEKAKEKVSIDEVAPERTTEFVSFVKPEGDGKSYRFEKLKPLALVLDVNDPSNQIVRISCYIKSNYDKRFSELTYLGDFAGEGNLYEFLLAEDLFIENVSYTILAQSFKILDDKFVYGSRDYFSLIFGKKEEIDFSWFKSPKKKGKKKEFSLNFIEPVGNNEVFMMSDLRPLVVSAKVSGKFSKAVWYIGSQRDDSFKNGWNFSENNKVVDGKLSDVLDEDLISSLLPRVEYVVGLTLMDKKDKELANASFELILEDLREATPTYPALESVPVETEEIKVLAPQETEDVGRLGITNPKYERKFSLGSSLKFKKGLDKHTIQLIAFDYKKKTARFLISSEPFEVELRYGVSQLVRFSDKKGDSILLSVNKVDDSGVNVTVSVSYEYVELLRRHREERTKVQGKFNVRKMVRHKPKILDEETSEESEEFRKEVKLYNVNEYIDKIEKLLDSNGLSDYKDEVILRIVSEYLREDIDANSALVNAGLTPPFLLYFENILDVQYLDWKNLVLSNYAKLVNSCFAAKGATNRIVAPVFSATPINCEVVDQEYVEGYNEGEVVKVHQLILIDKENKLLKKGRVIVAGGNLREETSGGGLLTEEELQSIKNNLPEIEDVDVRAETQPEMGVVVSPEDSLEIFFLLGIQQLQTLLFEYGLEEVFDEVSNKYEVYFRRLLDGSINPDIELGNALNQPQLYSKLFARNKSDAEKINNFLKSFLEIITVPSKMWYPNEITGYYLFPEFGRRFNAKRDRIIDMVRGTQFSNGQVVAIMFPAKYDDNGDVIMQAQVKIAR